ncbi:gremlin 1 [Tribolium castaneum]|uniref:Gremlin 1 n=1 Tax=Tribolium castaneum TaxID=7070 RepID=D2A239_TRICA|nr:PREDICTED: cerberus [Tribolium castaneum]EFA02797.1 gremlin 1 [Tribolium castaneum]|eukprot:XP_973724.1 PREDICTED: cerberus [Tribolium castaneum]
MVFPGIPFALCVFFSHQIITCMSRSPSSDSILEIINTKEVERLLAEKKRNISREERRYLLENELDENFIPPDQEFEIQKLKLLDEERAPRTENPRVDLNAFLRRNNHSEPYRTTELLQDLRGFNGRKLLKSSKNALFVTKKEYLQRDWCKTEPLIQKVKEEGCLTRTVINRFCYGQCNSFYIPKNPKKRHRHIPVSEETEDEDQNGPAFKACAFCRPSKFTWISVTLKCPSLMPPFRKKRIQRIKQCKCIAANVN